MSIQPHLPDWEDADVSTILRFLSEQGYGAKRLSRLLDYAISYRTLHRWRLGETEPNRFSDRFLLLNFCLEQGFLDEAEKDRLLELKQQAQEDRRVNLSRSKKDI